MRSGGGRARPREAGRPSGGQRPSTPRLAAGCKRFWLGGGWWSEGRHEPQPERRAEWGGALSSTMPSKTLKVAARPMEGGDLLRWSECLFCFVLCFVCVGLSFFCFCFAFFAMSLVFGAAPRRGPRDRCWFFRGLLVAVAVAGFRCWRSSELGGRRGRILCWRAAIPVGAHVIVRSLRSCRGQTGCTG